MFLNFIIIFIFINVELKLISIFEVLISIWFHQWKIVQVGPSRFHRAAVDAREQSSTKSSARLRAKSIARAASPNTPGQTRGRHETVRRVPPGCLELIPRWRKVFGRGQICGKSEYASRVPALRLQQGWSGVSGEWSRRAGNYVRPQCSKWRSHVNGSLAMLWDGGKNVFFSIISAYIINPSLQLPFFLFLRLLQNIIT